jgi:hypothetical protein
MGKGWEKVPPDSARQIAWYRPLAPLKVLAVQYDGTNGRAVEFVSGGTLSLKPDGRAYLSTPNWGRPFVRGDWVVKQCGGSSAYTADEFNKKFRYEGLAHVPGIDDEEDETVAKSESKAIVGDGEAQVAMYTPTPTPPPPAKAVRFNGSNVDELLSVTGGEVRVLFRADGRVALITYGSLTYEVREGEWVVKSDGPWRIFGHADFVKQFRYSGPAEPPPMKTLAMTVRVEVPRDTNAGNVVEGVKEALQSYDYSFDHGKIEVLLGNHFVNDGG